MKEITSTTQRNGGPGLVFLRAGFSHSVRCTSRPHIYIYLHVSKQACSKEGEGWGGLLLETTLRCPPAPAPRSTEVLILALDRGLALFVFTCIVCRLVFVRNTRTHRRATRNSQCRHTHTHTQTLNIDILPR